MKPLKQLPLILNIGDPKISSSIVSLQERRNLLPQDERGETLRPWGPGMNYNKILISRIANFAYKLKITKILRYDVLIFFSFKDSVSRN